MGISDQHQQIFFEMPTYLFYDLQCKDDGKSTRQGCVPLAYLSPEGKIDPNTEITIQVKAKARASVARMQKCKLAGCGVDCQKVSPLGMMSGEIVSHRGDGGHGSSWPLPLSAFNSSLFFTHFVCLRPFPVATIKYLRVDNL